MSPITIVGVVMGGLLISSAILISWDKKDFSAGSVAVTLIGVVLVGLSQWTSIKITTAVGSVELTTLKTQLRETAEAVDQVATQTKAAIVAIETTTQQVNLLAQSLTDNHVLSTATIQPIRARLDMIPRADVSKLDLARESLRRIATAPIQP